MRLDRDDLDADHRTLMVRNTKFGKSRQAYLHRSTVAALCDYSRVRDQLCLSPATASLFVSTSGARLCQATVQPAFRRLCQQARIGADQGTPHPRLGGLRHSFAVKTLLRWYQDGQDVQARLPALSTHLGHADPASTYWYLQAAPELLSLAAQRLQAAFETSS